MFRRARVAGHLPLLVLSGDDEVPLGQYLTDLGSTLAAEAAAEAPDAPAPAEQSQDDGDAAEAAAVAAHEAELEKVTATAPQADDDALEGDR